MDCWFDLHGRAQEPQGYLKLGPWLTSRSPARRRREKVNQGEEVEKGRLESRAEVLCDFPLRDE